MRSILKSLSTLLCFFTSIPLPKKLCSSTEFRSLYLVPLVGFVKGFVVAVPIAILKNYLSLDVAIVSSIAILLHFSIQGFLHVDGFIDFSEALIASRFGVDPYKVVKDKYRGSYAIATFSTYIIILYTSIYTLTKILNSIPLLQLLVLSEVWSSIVFLVLPYIAPAPPNGLGKKFKDSIKFVDIVMGIAIAVILTCILTLCTGNPMKGFYIVFYSLLAVTISTFITYTLSMRTLGFVNGDVLGFAFEISYLLTILTYVATVSTWI